ncbi:MAG TPA: hypothetical protein VJZ49_05160, partial [Syntrophales bacterium]|nr:hypothetical protein [Syntrophales bacterium]
MNGPLLKNIKCVRCWTRPVSEAERGISEKRMPIMARVATCLLLISFIIIASPRSAASEEDARLAVIASDLAAGTDIAVIIQNAVAAGLSVDRAVEALVTAGAEPGMVAYAAITANFPVSDVVRGAANAIAQLGLSEAALLSQVTTIVSAATTAGANPAQVNSGLVNTGIPPATIANAISRAASAPVFGYTAPATPPPAGPPIIAGPVGGLGGLIGGSGV